MGKVVRDAGAWVRDAEEERLGKCPYPDCRREGLTTQARLEAHLRDAHGPAVGSDEETRGRRPGPRRPAAKPVTPAPEPSARSEPVRQSDPEVTELGFVHVEGLGMRRSWRIVCRYDDCDRVIEGPNARAGWASHERAHLGLRPKRRRRHDDAGARKIGEAIQDLRKRALVDHERAEAEGHWHDDPQDHGDGAWAHPHPLTPKPNGEHRLRAPDHNGLLPYVLSALSWAIGWIEGARGTVSEEVYDAQRRLRRELGVPCPEDKSVLPSPE